MARARTVRACGELNLQLPGAFKLIFLCQVANLPRPLSLTFTALVLATGGPRDIDMHMASSPGPPSRARLSAGFPLILDAKKNIFFTVVVSLSNSATIIMPDRRHR